MDVKKKMEEQKKDSLCLYMRPFQSMETDPRKNVYLFCVCFSRKVPRYHLPLVHVEMVNDLLLLLVLPNSLLLSCYTSIVQHYFSVLFFFFILYSLALSLSYVHASTSTDDMSFVCEYIRQRYPTAILPYPPHVK